MYSMHETQPPDPGMWIEGMRVPARQYLDVRKVLLGVGLSMSSLYNISVHTDVATACYRPPSCRR